MNIFYFNVNEEKNPESEGIWTPYININNELREIIFGKALLYKYWKSNLKSQLQLEFATSTWSLKN